PNKNLRTYEINTRNWIKQFGPEAGLSDISKDYFKKFAEIGVDYIWMMGIWQTREDIIDETCFAVELVSGYTKVLPDWKREDIIGSAFSIDSYDVNPRLGSMDELLAFKETLNSLGLKLILDFVPNHLSAESRHIRTNPEFFLEADIESLQGDSRTFYKPHTGDGRVFAHGRDPFFLAWTDTVQVNFFSQKARNFLTDTLLKLTDLCDGVRCDMAMLALNNVFYNTWMGVLNKRRIPKPEDEFWNVAIKAVKKKSPEFLMVAEVYWDLEHQMQNLGFDYTYDKSLTDLLFFNDIQGIKNHLRIDDEIQQKSVRFIENHDELRAAAKFGKHRSLAAAAAISTIQGMKLFYDGQFDGKKIRVPSQLGREPQEKLSEYVKNFYKKLLSITSYDIFKKGKWRLIETAPIDPWNKSFENFLSWSWLNEKVIFLIAINYSQVTSQCRIKLDLNTDKETLKFEDLLNDAEYVRSLHDLRTNGLYVELKSYQSHIFRIQI
ncbi:MAG TPA: alpha-amylase family glycosyl hydrolase, partial [Ignavibacteriaceae bacterium]|nr:alpha-amylase family glycosyl hydrolase [Ignavibacteriaceae bacterium]